MKIATISTGFIDVPGKISLNIYTQGCKLRCPNCQNPELQPFDGGTDLQIDDIIHILNTRELCTWICWLGGDAVYQPDEFVQFNKRLKQEGFNICVYTGQLFKDTEHLFEDVDLVIDGQYEEELGGADSDSTNQRCFLKLDGEFQSVKFSEMNKRLSREKK